MKIKQNIMIVREKCSKCCGSGYSGEDENGLIKCQDCNGLGVKIFTDPLQRIITFAKKDFFSKNAAKRHFKRINLSIGSMDRIRDKANESLVIYRKILSIIEDCKNERK